MMKDILPIGSVVQLKNGEVKLMIINRFPLFNKEGTIGYFIIQLVFFQLEMLIIKCISSILRI